MNTSAGTDRIITCISNAGNIPSNTLAQFSHPLAFPLNVSKNEEWMLALHTLRCHNQIEGNESGVIKVRCEQVASALGTQKCISIHSRKPYKIGYNKTHIFKPKNYKWFPLATDILDHLSFILTDENNKNIKFSLGQPTLIVVVLRRIMSDQMQTLYVSSAVTEKFSENRANNFWADFPLELSQYNICPFEIAVSSMTYTPRFRQLQSISLPQKYDDRILFSVKVESNELEDPGTQVSSIRYNHEETFLCVEDLLRSVNALLDRTEVMSEWWKGSLKVKFFESRLRHSGRNVVGFALPDMPESVKMTIALPIRLAYQLGYRDVPTNGNHALITIRSGMVSEAQFSADHDFWLPETIMIYSNFTAPVMVGTNFNRVMKIFPVRLEDAESSSHVTAEDHHLDFHPIEQASLMGLNFQLRGLDGKLIDFEEKHRPRVLLTLLIRAKKAGLNNH